MARTSPSAFSKGTQLYVLLVSCLGALCVAFSLSEVVGQPLQWHQQWFSLVGLTLVSGLLPVTLPNVNVSISISETFVVAGTLLFGTAGGTVLVLLDALVISMRLAWSRRLKWQQIVFNLAAPPLSIWTAAKLAGIQPLLDMSHLTPLPRWFIPELALFTVAYFLLNSWLISFALALQKHVPPQQIWWAHFKELLVNYASGASIAALLVYNTRRIDPVFVAVIIPLLIVLYLTYQWSNKRVEAERQKTAELNRVFLSTVEALALAIDAKDQVTHGHIRRVQRYTMAMADALGVKDEKLLDAIKAAALLHDTGKLAVPEYILNKPGPLTSSEFERMKVHATVGADILKSIDFPYPVEPIVRHHHENWDGSGYPAGIRGQEIPLGARILSVVDCYDALTSDRPYRPRYTRQQAEHILRERRGVMYDPWVVDEFLKILDSLEAMDAAELQEARTGGQQVMPRLAPTQLDVISATTAEEREFNELRRDLPRATSLAVAADMLFRHLKRVVPAGTLALYCPIKDTNELKLVASSGVGGPALDGLRIPIGDRISGWAFAHQEVVVNSDATLEFGPVAKTFSVPLRYALAVPMLDRVAVGVITAYGSEPFDKDHRRMIESAATLFVSSLPQGSIQGATTAVVSAAVQSPVSPAPTGPAPQIEESSQVSGTPHPSVADPQKSRIH